MKKLARAMGMTAGVLLMAATSAFPQAEGRGTAIVTILPKQHNELPASVAQQDVSIKLNGKSATVASWTPQRGADDRLELVLLIDGAARNLNGSQFDEIAHFMRQLPSNAKATIGYMEDGRALLTGPLSTDRTQLLRGLHLPVGTNASTYFSVSDLAKQWPSSERRARREVLLVTDGIEPYNPQYDPEDTYVQSAINDSVRASLVVYSIFWSRHNNYSTGGVTDAGNSGQNYLTELTQATGGRSYGMGMSNPVSFQPYLDDLARRLANQYELGFSTSLNGKPVFKSMKFKLSGFAAEVDAPQQVFVDRAGAAK